MSGRGLPRQSDSLPTGRPSQARAAVRVSDQSSWESPASLEYGSHRNFDAAHGQLVGRPYLPANAKCRVCVRFPIPESLVTFVSSPLRFLVTSATVRSMSRMEFFARTTGLSWATATNSLSYLK